MVFFKDFSSSGKHFLSIVDNKDDEEQTGSVLPVFRPSADPFSPKWPKLESLPKLAEWSIADPSESPDHIFLQSPFHSEISHAKSFQTLGRRIVSGDVCWGCKLRLGGEFGFIKNYWEWTEYILGNYSTVLEEACIYNAVYASLYTYDRNPDIIRAFCETWCPTTNTLHTSAGELSISLWDLRLLGGLPIVGDIYEEVNPSALELTGVSERTNTKFVPYCCEFLFSAYHFLRKRQGSTSQVSINTWIRFWFRGDTKHEFNKPRVRKSKSITRPRSTHNPDGNLDESRKRTPSEEAVFDDLGISSAFRDKTYLASFLSCWLCVFVLPTSKESIIRPGTFKIASFLAEGHTYSLAVPVLASMYRGLNEISKSSHPERSCSHFPFHYGYGWLAFYFGTHYLIPDEARGSVPGPKMSKYSGEGGAKYFDEREARELIHVGRQAKWCELMINNSSETLIDNGNLCLSRLSYFLSLRSSYLVLRQVDSIIVEPYSPNRFSRQFGFCQTLPGDLKKNARSATPKQALEYWRICLAKSTFASVSLPVRCEHPNAHTTQSYLEWWLTVHGNYLTDGLEALIESMTSKSSKSKRIKKRKSQESSDSEGFVDLEDDDNDNYEGGSTAKDGSEQPTSHPSSIRQTPKGTPSVQRSHPCRLLSVVEGERVEDSQEHDERPYIQSTPKKSKPPVVQRIILHDTNLATFFDGVPSSSCAIGGANEQLGECELVVGENDDMTLDAAAFSCSEPSVIGPLDYDLEMKTIESPPDITSPFKKVAICHGVRTIAPKTKIVPTRSCSTYQPTKIASSFVNKAIQGLGTDLLELLKHAPFDRVSRVHEAAPAVYESISSLNGDPNPLKDIVDSYVGGVNAYLRFQDQLTGCVSERDVATKKVKATKDLETVKSNLAISERDESDLGAALASVKWKRTALEETLRSLLQEELKMEEDLKAKHAAVKQLNTKWKKQRKFCMM